MSIYYLVRRKAKPDQYVFSMDWTKSNANLLTYAWKGPRTTVHDSVQSVRSWEIKEFSEVGK
jgi:hypothetical protein